MKKGIGILVMAFFLTSIGFSQEYSKIQKTKSFHYEGESEKTELKIKIDEQFNYLKLAVRVQIEKGDMQVEILNPDGEKKGNFSVSISKTEKLQSGNKTTVRETATGSMEKNYRNPEKGEWIIRFIPSDVWGQAGISIEQAFQPKADMIEIEEIEEVKKIKEKNDN